MGTRRLLVSTAGAVLAAILVLGFLAPYSLDCGPLERRACEARATEIVAIVSREFPGIGVSSIVIFDSAGRASVLLRSGTRLDVTGQQVTEGLL